LKKETLQKEIHGFLTLVNGAQNNGFVFAALLKLYAYFSCNQEKDIILSFSNGFYSAFCML